jgi:hypothetical protein
MNHTRTLCLTALALLSASAARAEDPVAKGLRLAQEADRINSGYVGEKSTMTMELINAHGDVTKRRMIMEISEGTTDGDRSRSVFEWPADVKGTKMLTWTHKKGDDDQWLYLPAVKRTKRISSNNKSGSFMGSEFAYEDLGSVEVEKFTFKYLDEPTLAGRACYRVERYPVDKNSGYKRQVVWMDKEYSNPLKIEYFDRKDELLKVAHFEAYKKFGKHWRIGRIRVENVQTKKKSIISWENRQVGIKLPPELFDSARMED